LSGEGSQRTQNNLNAFPGSLKKSERSQKKVKITLDGRETAHVWSHARLVLMNKGNKAKKTTATAKPLQLIAKKLKIMLDGRKAAPICFTSRFAAK